ncbi:MAG: DNA topoisomerase III [Verrucomicrobiota bacterium]
MGKGLIIAEKPSVATDISRAIGGFSKQQTSKSAGRDGEYLESDDFVLSSAVGHLVELSAPEQLEKRKGKWTFGALPVIPEHFDLRPIAKTEPRLKLLLRLIKRKDVDYLVNACDAGREGELIFRYIVRLSGTDKAIKRLWLQSMTPDAIRDGFENLGEGREFEPLAAAAVCRSESDWLVGINGTRALTAFNSKGGGFQKTTVGRVQTPTLAMVVERDGAIKAHVPRDYWEVHGTFGVAEGTYEGRWLAPDFDPAEREKDPHLRAERLWDRERAEAIVAACEGQTAEVSQETKPSSQAPPLLYDLTSLQREANGRYGFPARRTLQLAQALYERHKVLTYPRTDSRALPQDYLGTVKAVMGTLKAGNLETVAGKVLANDWIQPNKRIFNNAKVSDHHAIIPTQQAPNKLDEAEAKIYDLVARRFVAIFFPSARYEITTRLSKVAAAEETHTFQTNGKVLKEPGWLEVYGKGGAQDDDTLVAVAEGESAEVRELEIRDEATRPPARYNEATLLSAMEGAGKLVDHDELRDAMAAKGLGTPATRAAIIEGLLREEYLRREGREILSTPKATALLDLLGALEVPALRSAEMTGEWEYKLKQMEQGEYTRQDFMNEIEDVTRKIVERARNFEEEEAPAKDLGVKTPEGQPVIETLREYRTADGGFAIRKVMGNRLLEPEELDELLQKRFIGPLQGFRSRAGWPFAAALKLTDEGKVEFVFDNAPVDKDGNPLDLSKEEPVGICPIDGGKVYELMMSYSCENALGDEPTCKFKIGKKILEQPISREQAGKILREGRSDMLGNFRSNKRGRKQFAATLVLDRETGKLNFEFPEREKKPRGNKTAAKS